MEILGSAANTPPSLEVLCLCSCCRPFREGCNGSGQVTHQKEKARKLDQKSLQGQLHFLGNGKPFCHLIAENLPKCWLLWTPGIGQALWEAAGRLSLIPTSTSSWPDVPREAVGVSNYRKCVLNPEKIWQFYLSFCQSLLQDKTGFKKIQSIK